MENLISKKELTSYLDVSLGMVDKLMKEDLPYIKIGKSVKFKSNNHSFWFVDTIHCVIRKETQSLIRLGFFYILILYLIRFKSNEVRYLL